MLIELCHWARRYRSLARNAAELVALRVDQLMAVRRLVVRAVAILVCAPAFGQAAETPRLGILVSGSSSAPDGLIAVFRQGLAELGYIEGRTIQISYRYSEGAYGRLTDLANELMQTKPHLLFAAGGNDIARTLKRVAGKTPIVMGGGSDPVGSGLIESLARPGGNITGLTSLSATLTGKRLEIIRELVSEKHRIAVLYNPGSRQKRREVVQIQRAAKLLGIEIRLIEVHTTNDIASAIALAVESQAGAMSVLSDSFTRVNQKTIGALAIKHKLPTMFADRRRMVGAGGLISYGPDYADMWRRAAGYVDKILRGAKPSNLPVEQPAKFELVVNLETARALGIAIPPSILLRANKVIE